VTDDCGATGSHSITATVTDPDPCLNNQPPVADAGPDQSAQVGDSISFDGSASFDNDGQITTYRWTFGDGSSAQLGAVVSHAYANAATYTAILTVTDNCNRSATDSVLVTITQPEEDPGEVEDYSDFEILPSESVRVFEPITFPLGAGRSGRGESVLFLLGSGRRGAWLRVAGAGANAVHHARRADGVPDVVQSHDVGGGDDDEAGPGQCRHGGAGIVRRRSFLVMAGDWHTPKGQAEIDGTTRQATVAWVAGVGKVVAFDVTNPNAEPRQLGVWRLGSDTHVVNLSASDDGRLVAVSLMWAGLVLLDATHPQDIQEAGRYLTYTVDGSQAYASAFNGSYLYLTVPARSLTSPATDAGVERR
jgi:PKD repeat protein